jgi:sarcosine oxidase
MLMDNYRHKQSQHPSGIERQGRDAAFDVIVLGVGSMGSATCYYLSKAGLRVLGIEQFDIPHELGSHHGQSRIIRKAYFEHPDYVPLLERAYTNWRALEAASGVQIYLPTGLLYLGRADHFLVRDSLASAMKYGIRMDKLGESVMRNRYPQVRLPEHFTCLFEPDAGLVTPERAVLAYTDLAIRNGAVIQTKTQVHRWEKNGSGYIVETNRGRFSAQKMVITAGPYTSELVPELSSSLAVTRQVAAWVIPKDPSAFALGNWPCWTLAEDGKPGIYYGFPVLPVGQFNGPIGFKLAHHSAGDACKPHTVSRDPTPEDEANLVRILDKYFPGSHAMTHLMKTCLYTNTPDEHFIIDFLPGHDKSVAIAAGFSGHGFKFASAVGEILADLVTRGKTPLPVGFLHAGRLFDQAVNRPNQPGQC